MSTAAKQYKVFVHRQQDIAAPYPSPMQKVRVGYVRYLNTAPLVEGLDSLCQISATAAVPAHLAAMLEREEIDIGLVSVIDAARSKVELVLLPVGMIGCDGPTLTVRLFSSVPFAELAAIYADTDSHTSVILCRVLLKKLYGVEPRVEPFHARERFSPTAPIGENSSDLDQAWPPAVLLIGDKVITDPPPQERYPHQLDLGEAWKKMTGLPFVYAMWMCRKNDPAMNDILVAARVLDHQRRHNLSRIDWLVSQRAPVHRWPVETAQRYLGQLLKYEVGPRDREGCQKFIDLAAQIGAVQPATLQFQEM